MSRASTSFLGDEAIRATVLTLGALQKHGIEHPERNIVVVPGRDFFGGTYGTTLARLTPFTARRSPRIGKLADERGLGIAFAAGGPYQAAWKDLAAATSWQAFCHSYHFDVCPPTDDKPFFFNMRRLSDVGSARPSGYAYSVDPTDLLLLTLAVLVVLSIIGFAPAAVRPRAAAAARGRCCTSLRSASAISCWRSCWSSDSCCSSAFRRMRCRWCCSRCCSSPGWGPTRHRIAEAARSSPARGRRSRGTDRIQFVLQSLLRI